MFVRRVRIVETVGPPTESSAKAHEAAVNQAINDEWGQWRPVSVTSMVTSSVLPHIVRMTTISLISVLDPGFHASQSESS